MARMRPARRSARIGDAIASDVIDKLGIKIELQFLANDTGKEPTHRMRLPTRRLNDGFDRAAICRSQQSKHPGLLGIGASAGRFCWRSGCIVSRKYLRCRWPFCRAANMLASLSGRRDAPPDRPTALALTEYLLLSKRMRQVFGTEAGSGPASIVTRFYPAFLISFRA
jgi:hypothetical protein